MKGDQLEDIRQQINAVDDQLLKLLNRRAQLVLDLGRVKFANGLKLFDPERERFIFEHATAGNQGPLSREAVTRLFERIIDESRRLERTEVYDKAEE